MTSGALDGVTVLDFSPMLPGQTCSMILGDLGARIICVEHPDGGHYSRRLGLPASFESVNRNKESITVDLKNPAGRTIAQQLAASADVVLEGFRPGVAARLEIDYPLLSKANTRLVYCAISGYGQDGAWRDLPGHDPNYLAVAGVLSLAGEPSGPPSADLGTSIADLAAGWFATIAILAALRERDNSGVGQYIDMAMADAAFALVQNRMTESLANADLDKARLMGRPGVGLFEAADGLHLTVGAVEDKFWTALCTLMGAEDLIADPGLQTTRQRRVRGDELRRRLATEFRQRPRDEWIELLRRHDIPCAPVYSLREAAASDYARERHLIEEVAHPGFDRLGLLRFPPVLSRTPGVIRTRPPLLGEHTDAILAELGHSSAAISRLHSSGAV